MTASKARCPVGIMVKPCASADNHNTFHNIITNNCAAEARPAIIIKTDNITVFNSSGHRIFAIYFDGLMPANFCSTTHTAGGTPLMPTG